MSLFHLHVDAVTISPGLDAELGAEFGFLRTDFCGHPRRDDAYEPPHHLTRKLDDSAEFRRLFEALRDRASAPGAMTGYLEGEFVPVDRELTGGDFDPDVRAPCTLRRTTLPPGEFRESEVHVTMCRDRSEPRLIESLMDMGLFGAFLPKSYGTAVVLTTQGSRAIIGELLPVLGDYIERAGGAVEGSIKEERIAEWWMSDPGVRLPPIVRSIDWAA